MTYVQTRPQLEANVRRRVAGLDNVSFRLPVVGRRTDRRGRSGGRCERSATARRSVPISSSMRADATAAQRSGSPSMGYDPAPETYVNCDVSYTSVIVQPDVWDAFEGSVFFLMPTGRANTPGVTARSSSCQANVGCCRSAAATATRHRPTGRPFGPTATPSSTRSGHDLPQRVTPVTDIKTYRMARAVRHHYEQVERFPEGLLPIADSVCFFNPIHGQGMSSAAGQCRGLSELLAQRAASGWDARRTR